MEIFDYEPSPSADLNEAALSAHKDATERQLKTYYTGTNKEEFRPGGSEILKQNHCQQKLVFS